MLSNLKLSVLRNLRLHTCSRTSGRMKEMSVVWSSVITIYKWDVIEIKYIRLF